MHRDGGRVVGRTDPSVRRVDDAIALVDAGAVMTIEASTPETAGWSSNR